MNHNTIRVAVCGVLTALCTVLMFLTSFIPVGTYALPAIAGVLLIIIVIEIGLKWAWAVYFVSAVLAVLVAGDKEAALLFVLFFGYYPVLKAVLEKMKNHVVSYIVKFAVFNAAMIVGFFAAIYLLGIPQDSFTLFGVNLPLVFLLVGNVVFFIYDKALSLLVIAYFTRLHRVFAKWLPPKL